MDKQTLMYLVFLGIYILSRFLKKKKPTGVEGEFDQPSKTSPKSLEDLLKEFSQPEKPAEQPVVSELETVSEAPKRKSGERYVMPTDDEQKAKQLKWENVSQQKNKYQQAIEEGLLDESINIDSKSKDVDDHFKEFKIKTKKRGLARSIRRQLTSPVGVKKAVLLSEVLKQKF